MIKSISYENDEILKNIIELHTGEIECDITYSTGNFYKNINPPRLKYDMYPQTTDTQKITAVIPHGDLSINNIVFDPPFIIQGPKKEYETSRMFRRFNGFINPQELKYFYKLWMEESYRVLKKGGFLIVKCQDTVTSGRQLWTHQFVMNEAEKIGFYIKDLFILLAKQRMTDKRKQQHARKFHSYFIILQKK